MGFSHATLWTRPRTPEDQVAALIDVVTQSDLHPGTERSLLAKLESALDALERGKEKAACNKLEAFTHEVAAQSGKKLTAALADEFTERASQIQAALGCR